MVLRYVLSPLCHQTQFAPSLPISDTWVLKTDTSLNAILAPFGKNIKRRKRKHLNVNCRLLTTLPLIPSQQKS
jgi:hypothetical protein